MKIEKFVGDNLSHFHMSHCLACLVVEFNYKSPFNTGGNDKNDHFRYIVGVHVRLIEISFKVKKGNKFGDFGYCPLHSGCLLNKIHDLQ